MQYGEAPYFVSAHEVYALHKFNRNGQKGGSLITEPLQKYCVIFNK